MTATEKPEIAAFGVTLFRIRATRTFSTWLGDVEEGQLGGYVRSEDNLAHGGKAWVGGEAWVDSWEWLEVAPGVKVLVPIQRTEVNAEEAKDAA